MSITAIAHQAQGIRAGEVIAKLAEDAYFMRFDNRDTQPPPPGTATTTAETPTMRPTRGPVAEVVAAVETTRTATPPEPHRVATTPARRLKNCGGRSPPQQATTTASPPSLLGFATYSSRTSSNLWESPSTT
jgi:hypothetical protein